MTAPILSIRSADAIDRAAALLTAGELVVVPTDTVYGIATLYKSPDSVALLYVIRNRPPEPAVPFLLSDRCYIQTLTRPNPVALRLSHRFWPGALTIILPPAHNVTRHFKSMPVALRMPNYPPLEPLLRAVGGYMFTSGATSSGYPPAISAQEAAAMFGEHVALILDGGPTPYGVYSTIVNCIPSPPEILRRGLIPEEKIWAALNLTSPDSVVLDG